MFLCRQICYTYRLLLPVLQMRRCQRQGPDRPERHARLWVAWDACAWEGTVAARRARSRAPSAGAVSVDASARAIDRRWAVDGNM